MTKKEALITMIAVAALALPAFAKSSGETDVLWSIGGFDGSSDEFSSRLAASPKAAPFVVGKSDEVKNWGAYQPIAGPNSQPREIRFSLKEAPAGAFRLRVAILFENVSIPALRVSINGHRGLFYPHPKLDSRMGDPAGGSRPLYSQAELNIDFPADWLNAGDNTIALEPVSTTEQAVPDAGLNYDALSLSRVPAAFDAQAVSAEIVPTIFYQKKDGQLCELVEVLVRYGAGPREGEVALEIAGKPYRQPLKGGQDFGEERLVFAVPEFSGEVAAKAKVSIDGRTREVEQTVAPQKKWTLFLVPHVHLDVGYTDYQAKVAEIHSRILDQAMSLIATNPEYRYSMDGSWELEQFMRTRKQADRDRVIKALKDRKIFLPAQNLILFTGFSTAEMLIRSLYASANFHREDGVPFEYANLTDSPSYSWSFASVLASAGIDYFLAGSNNDRGPILLKGRLHETPYWWEGPDKKRVLAWYAHAYRHMQMLFGLPPLATVGRETLPVFMQTYQKPAYLADSVILYGSQGENRELFPEQAQLAKQWNDTYAWPRLQYSGFKDALEAIARQFGDSIPTFRGDGGPYWEDDVAANPIHAAMARESGMRGPSAEKLATISSLANPLVQADKQALDEMWANMVLFAEHTAASHLDEEHSPEKVVDQLRVKNRYATTARDMCRQVLQGSMAVLADLMLAGKDSLVVFNTLNWARSGLVSFDLSGGEIVDAATDKAVPVELVSIGRGFRRVRFVAENVPAMGYKVYRLRSSAKNSGAQKAETMMTLEDMVLTQRRDSTGGGKASSGQPAELPTTLESPYYKVELDPSTGAVKSIFDKELRKELVDAGSPYRFGQYLYVTGGDKMLNGLLQYAKEKPELEVHPAGKGRLISVNKTPYGWSAKLESSAISTRRIGTEIRLFEKEKKIEFIENVTKNQMYQREGVYFAFPFAMDHPQFQYEIQNGVVDPDKTMLPGAGKEWFTIQHWVSAQQDGVSATVMPLDAALVALGDINRGEWPTEFGRRKGTIFSEVQNNYHQPRSLTDFHSEVIEDNMRFRYVVTSAPSTDPVKLSRMGWEEATPLEKNEIQPQDKSWPHEKGLDGTQGSFIHADDPALVLTTWKPAEDGNGTILRFIDLGGKARTVTVKAPLWNLTQVHQTDAVERNLKSLPVADSHQFQFDVQPHEITTIRLETAPVAAFPRE